MDLLEPSWEKFSGSLRRGEVHAIPQDRPPDCEKFATDLNFHNVLYDDVCLSQEGEDVPRRIWKVWSRKERDGECTKVLTMYKRKDKKVNPGDAPLSGGSNQEVDLWIG
jgi:mannosyltransferase OCH1-like enzyme